MTPPTGTRLPVSPLPLLKGRGFLLKTKLPEPLPHHRALPGGSDAIHEALIEYTTYYLTLKSTFASAINTRYAQLIEHLASKLMPLITYMLELEALVQHCFDTHLTLVKEVQAFLPVLGEPTPLPELIRVFRAWEADMLKRRLEALMIVRARCVVAARAVSQVSEEEEEVAFRERFLGMNDESAFKKAKGQ